MPELEYSNDALNVLGKFYAVDTMLFVEGDEDIPFWEYLFETFSSIDVEVQSVGGKPKLIEYTEKIVSGESKVIVAMDNDYSLFDNIVTHPSILRTFGYSIENTIISVNTIKKSIRSLGKIQNKEINLDEITLWLDDFLEKIKLLFIHDICNFVQKYGTAVAGCNCARFMKSNSSDMISQNKLEEYINNLEFNISDDEIINVGSKLQEHGFKFSDIVRGHFLFSAIHRYIVTYIKRKRSKISISVESMFSTLMLSFEQLFDEDHLHFAHYKESIENVSIVT